MTHQTVYVIDFGGQYTQLIVRRVRELGIYSEMVPWTEATEKLASHLPDAVILSGGPRSTLEKGAPNIDFKILEGIPTLGICYGMQLMGLRLGGRVEKAGHKEYGYRTIVPADGASLVSDLASNQVWMSHGDQVLEVPPGFVATSSTDSCPIASFENPGQCQYGVQFHPEVSHTPDGRTILRRFLFDHAELKADWTSQKFIEEEVERIRTQVGGTRKVLCAVSGGVDSSVMAALLIKAIGERAVCVFVDQGLLRKNEAMQVIDTFG
ncbi:MAG: glutamine-hydrolyzing GMP synthase, partial [Fimbriimonadaceae bacterium]|nr:glutamine-hydrolyzing GMP synthase [Fimbriimonadaceae bacterium]